MGGFWICDFFLFAKGFGILVGADLISETCGFRILKAVIICFANVGLTDCFVDFGKWEMGNGFRMSRGLSFLEVEIRVGALTKLGVMSCRRWVLCLMSMFGLFKV